MKLTPRYDGPAVLRFEGPPDDVATPLVRQRQRLADTLDELTPDQWVVASRCDGWTVRDVVAHLASVDQFWLATIRAALAGAPSRYLVDFDPVTVPAAMVAATEGQTVSETLGAFHLGIDALAAAIEGVDGDQWELPAEAPPGHVPLHALVRHALWDAWIHERDILLPLGLDPVVEPDEVAISLGYVAALGPSLAPSPRSGRLVVAATEPTFEVTVELGETVVLRPSSDDDQIDRPGAVRLTGRAVELIEAISLRAPFPCHVAETDRWIFGLTEAFDATPSPD